MNNANEFTSLLRKKEDLKLDVKRAKRKVEAQKNSIENQKQRAENGKSNTLAFEQRQLPVFISELQKVENELKEVKIKIKTFELVSNDLKLRDKDNNDKNGFPINKEGKQVAVFDENGNIMLLLSNNFLAKFPENSCIKFNPNNKDEVHTAIDALVNVLTQNFNKNIKGYFTIDLTDEAKREHNLRTHKPTKIPKVQMYFDWVDNWLQYLDNIADSNKLKLLFYKKYKDKIKKTFISLETNLNQTNVSKNYIEFAKKWLEQTDKSISFETQLIEPNTNSRNLKSVISDNDRIFLNDLQNHLNNKETLYEYEAHLSFFKEQKYLVVNYKNRKYKVYSPGLAYLFSSKDVNVRNMETKKDFKLDTRLYFQTFVEAFVNGEKHFENDYEVSKNVFYGSNTNTIVSDIHTAYYHTIHKEKFIGWAGVIHSNPLIITHKILENYGYYSGVLSKADEFIAKYPNAFKDFHKCNDNKEPQSTGKITKEELLEYDNKLIPKVSLREVFNHFEILTKTTNKDNVVYLTEKQLLNFIKSTFIENLPKQQEFNGFLYSKKDVRSVFYRFYKKSTLLESKQTGLKQKYFDIMNNSFKGFNSTDFKEFNKTNNKVTT